RTRYSHLSLHDALPILLDAWGQYKKLARTDQWITWIEPIRNRVQPMLSDPRIRPILTKAKGDLNVRNILKDGEVLLVRIPQGQLDRKSTRLNSSHLGIS